MSSIPSRAAAPDAHDRQKARSRTADKKRCGIVISRLKNGPNEVKLRGTRRDRRMRRRFLAERLGHLAIQAHVTQLRSPHPNHPSTPVIAPTLRPDKYGKQDKLSTVERRTS